MFDDEDAAAANAEAVGIGPCNNCGYPVDSVTPVDDGDTLHVGAVIICIACGFPLVVDEAGGLGLFVRPPTQEEWASIAMDPVVRKVLAAQAAVAPTIAKARRERGE